MPVSNTAVHIPDRVYVLIADVATAVLPTKAQQDTFIANRATTPSGWTEFAQTSLDALPEIALSSDGGEPVLAASQDVVGTTGRTSSLAVNMTSIQIDDISLGFYFGAGGTSSAGNKFKINTLGTPTERALWFVITTAAGGIGQVYPRASIIGNDSVSVDRENPLSLPLVATILSKSGASLVEWVGASVGTT